MEKVNLVNGLDFGKINLSPFRSPKTKKKVGVYHAKNLI